MGSRQCGASIHPAPVVRILVGINVSAFLVEMHIPVLFAHVHLKLARCPPPLPAVVVVAQAEEALAACKSETPAWSHLDIEVAEERSAKLRKCEESLIREEHRQCDQQVNRYKVFRF